MAGWGIWNLGTSCRNPIKNQAKSKSSALIPYSHLPCIYFDKGENQVREMRVVLE